MRIVRSVLAEAPLAWLLLAVPIAAWMHHARPESPLLVFIMACVAIVPLAGLLGVATEKLAARLGEGIGGFLNATLGNAAELIIALVALRAGMLDVVKASLTGSIIGNLLLVLGAAFLAGGLRYKIQNFATIGVRTQIGMMALAAIFFKIRKGIVAVSHTLDDGRRQIMALRAPGDCVGYLDKNGAYAFEGEALTDVEACAFNRRKFDAFVAENPDLGAALVEALSSALKQAGMLSLVLGQLRSTERVAHFLAEISALYAERHVCLAQPLTLHMGRHEIADYLGLTIETVSRSIGKLKSRNIIALVESGEVLILDFERLRQAGKVSG